LSSISDTTLWEKLKSGDRNAFKDIYENEFQFLFHYGLKVIMDSQMVEDAIQELFIELWDAKQRLSSTDSIRKYVAISLKRKLIKKQIKQRKTDLKENFTDGQFNVEVNIEDEIIAGEISEEQKSNLEDAISELAPRQKEVMYLRFNSGIDNEGIAEILNISNQSVRNLISTAIKNLTKRMSVKIILIIMSTMIQ